MPLNLYGIANQTYQARNARYVADTGGFLPNVANNDVGDLLESGCIPMSAGRVLGRVIGANMNVTTDQPIFLNVPAGARYRLTEIWVANASVSLTTAVGGVYTAAAKGGTVLVLATQAYTAFTAATVLAAITVVAAQLAVTQNANPIYLSLTTPQGAAATADFFVFGDILG
jgi:hypothetical protein